MCEDIVHAFSVKCLSFFAKHKLKNEYVSGIFFELLTC